MKTHKLLFVLVFLLHVLTAQAKGPGGQGMGPMSGGGHGSGGLQGGPPSMSPGNAAGMSSLERFLSLDDEELAQLEAVIQRIRKMTPDEREAYRQKILQYQGMEPEQRQNLQLAWGQLDANVKSAWRDYMMNVSGEEREAIRDKMMAVPFEDRTRWRIEKLVEAGLLTPEQAENILGPDPEKPDKD